MSLQKLVGIVDDAPWCGTKPPGFPRPHPHLAPEFAALSNAVYASSLNPQPLPPRGGDIEAFLWQAVRLYQYGQLLSKANVAEATASGLTQTANEIYDGAQCGSVPLSVLLSWLLHNPPPPPPVWVDVISQAVTNILIGQSMKGEVGSQLQSGAIAVIDQYIGKQQEQGNLARTAAAGSDR